MITYQIKATKTKRAIRYKSEQITKSLRIIRINAAGLKSKMS